MKYSPASSTDELLLRWLRRLRESQFCHYEAASALSHANLLLGIPVVVLSTVVGTSVFASLESNPESWIRIIVGLTSVVAAVLASLQTFLGFLERAEKHRATASRYGIVRRAVEELIASGAVDASDKRIADLRTKIDNLAVDVPGIPDRIMRRAESKMEYLRDDESTKHEIPTPSAGEAKPTN